jgi:hypothetical protein
MNITDPFRKHGRTFAESIAKTFDANAPDGAGLIFPNVDREINTIIVTYFSNANADADDISKLRDDIYFIFIARWISLTVPECWDEDQLRENLHRAFTRGRYCDLNTIENKIKFEKAIDSYYDTLSDNIFNSLYSMKEVLKPDELSTLIPELRTNLFRRERIMIRYMTSMKNLKNRGKEWDDHIKMLEEIEAVNSIPNVEERVKVETKN